MPELLNRYQVAVIANIEPTSVRMWAARRGIAPVRRRGERSNLYPAAAIRDARIPVKAAEPEPIECRLARFIRNPLNYVVGT